MSHISEPSPPFMPTPAKTQTVDHWTGRHPALLVAASVVVGLLAAVPIGSLTGFVVYEVFAGSCANDGWCELGAAIYGALAGAVVGGITHVAAGVLFIRRYREAGRRWLPIMAHSAAPVAAFVVLSLLSGI